MKPDTRLMKEILTATRDKNPNDTWVTFTFTGYSNHAVNDHVRLADDLGLIEMIDLSSIGSKDYKPRRLTAYGHDYLNSKLAPWWRKLFSSIWNMTGKLVWVAVGAAIGAASTILVQHFLTDFIN